MLLLLVVVLGCVSGIGTCGFLDVGVGSGVRAGPRARPSDCMDSPRGGDLPRGWPTAAWVLGGCWRPLPLDFQTDFS